MSRYLCFSISFSVSVSPFLSPSPVLSSTFLTEKCSHVQYQVRSNGPTTLLPHPFHKLTSSLRPFIGLSLLKETFVPPFPLPFFHSKQKEKVTIQSHCTRKRLLPSIESWDGLQWLPLACFLIFFESSNGSLVCLCSYVCLFVKERKREREGGVRMWCWWIRKSLLLSLFLLLDSPLLGFCKALGTEEWARGWTWRITMVALCLPVVQRYTQGLPISHFSGQVFVPNP